MEFATYSDALRWIKEGEGKMGKMKFRSSAEYQIAYPHIVALYKSEGHKRSKRHTIVRSICMSV